MKVAGLIFREHSEQAKRLAGSASARLRALGLTVRTLASQGEFAGAEALSEAEFSRGLELMVVVGGDGTLLRAAQLVSSPETAVLGVKLGGLGFLTEIQPEELDLTLDQVVTGKALYMKRMMLEGWIQDHEARRSFRALNEVAITHAGVNRIVDLDTEVDGVFVTSFRADGLLVSTPTGSTAYNLAVGGPIIHPVLHCIILTAISPHTLTARPLVIPESASVRVRLANPDREARISPDAQQSWPLRAGDVVEIRAAAAGLKLICSPSKNYYEVLRTKLRWGER